MCLMNVFSMKVSVIEEFYLINLNSFLVCSFVPLKSAHASI